MKRVKEVAEATAKVYGADTEVEIDAGGPPLICDPSTTKEFVGYMRELKLPETMEYPNISASASEDFAFVAEQVPSTFMYLSSGYMDERGAYSAHNPKVQFNEEVLPHGFGKTEAVTPQQLLYLIAVTQVHGPPSLRMVAYHVSV